MKIFEIKKAFNSIELTGKKGKVIFMASFNP